MKYFASRGCPPAPGERNGIHGKTNIQERNVCMKRIKISVLFVSILVMALLCLTGCSQVEEIEFEWPEPFSKIDTGLQESIAYDIDLNGMTGAAMYNGEIYVCNKTTNNVTCYEKDFTLKRTIGKMGSRDGELLSPEGMWVDDDGVHVLDWGNNRIARFAHDGAFIANYPITGTYSHLVTIWGFCRTNGRYLVSFDNEYFLCKLLIVPEIGENKVMDADGIGDFLVKDGVPYLFTQGGTAKNGRDNNIYSLKSGALYQCNDQELVKVCDLHPGINPTPFVYFGDWYLSIARTPRCLCVYSQETNELLGYAMELSDVGKVGMLTPLQEIRLLADDDTLYFLWPSDHKVYTWTRSAT